MLAQARTTAVIVIPDDDDAQESETKLEVPMVCKHKDRRDLQATGTDTGHLGYSPSPEA